MKKGIFNLLELHFSNAELQITNKAFIVVLCVFAMLYFGACSEDFSPKTSLADEYVLNCVIETNAENAKNEYMVSALISHVYDVNGFDPSVNKNDPAIEGAQVYITEMGKTYPLNGGKKYMPGYKYGDSVYLYTGRINAYHRDSVSIFAKLKNGKILTAAARIPDDISIKLAYPFDNGFTSQIVRFLYGNGLIFNWDAANSGHLFFPRARISYFKGPIMHPDTFYVDVPAYYEIKDGKKTPVYPAYQLNMDYNFDFSVIDTTMSLIAASDTLHEFTFDGITVDVLEMDAALSSYYSSVHGYLDHVTIRLDEDTYTNINGGIGIFGASRSSFSVKLGFAHYYLTMFGY